MIGGIDKVKTISLHHINHNITNAKVYVLIFMSFVFTSFIHFQVIAIEIEIPKILKGTKALTNCKSKPLLLKIRITAWITFYY